MYLIFSEGVDKEVIAAIANRVRDSSEVRVLGIEPDPDYNRTVLTFLLVVRMMFLKEHVR